MSVLLQPVRAERGAKIVYVTVTVATVIPIAARQPAVPSVRPASRGVTVTTTSTSVLSTTLVTTTPRATTSLAPSSVSARPGSRSTTPLCAKACIYMFTVQCSVKSWINYHIL